MISPLPLHMATIIEFTGKLNVSNGIARRGALKLVINNIIPPIRPLFSTIVHSAKYARHEGIPEPNEMPKRIEMIKRCVRVKLLNRAGSDDVTTPAIIHK